MPGCPAVEPKRKLVEVIFQLLTGYSTLMGAQHPPFQQSRDPMHSRQKSRCRFSAPADHPGGVREALLLQPVVRTPSVGDDHGPWFDCHLDEREKCLGGGIRNPMHPNPADSLAVDLRGAGQQGLISQVSTDSASVDA